MNIQDLYNWAVENNALELEIKIRDTFEEYCRPQNLESVYIHKLNKETAEEEDEIGKLVVLLGGY